MYRNAIKTTMVGLCFVFLCNPLSSRAFASDYSIIEITLLEEFTKAEVIQIYKGWDICQSQLLARFMKSGNRLIDDFGSFKVVKFSGGKPLSIFHCAKLPNN